MENRKQILVVLLIAAVIVVAIFSSFGLNLFGSTPEVHLPVVTDGPGQSGDDPGGQTTDTDRFVRVEITPKTVQSVIATLTRPESYDRAITVETFQADGTVDTQVNQVWVDGGWTRTETVLPSGQTRYTIVGDEAVYRWYSGDREAVRWSAETDSGDLEGQRIPTYEDVLALNVMAIAETNYQERGGVACIYVETAPDDLGYVSRYWVSVSSRLLVSAEVAEGERLLYRMSAYTLEQPAPQGTVFALPDGTLLHSVG